MASQECLKEIDVGKLMLLAEGVFGVRFADQNIHETFRRSWKRWNRKGSRGTWEGWLHCPRI